MRAQLGVIVVLGIWLSLSPDIRNSAVQSVIIPFPECIPDEIFWLSAILAVFVIVSDIDLLVKELPVTQLGWK